MGCIRTERKRERERERERERHLQVHTTQAHHSPNTNTPTNPPPPPHRAYLFFSPSAAKHHGAWLKSGHSTTSTLASWKFALNPPCKTATERYQTTRSSLTQSTPKSRTKHFNQSAPSNGRSIKFIALSRTKPATTRLLETIFVNGVSKNFWHSQGLTWQKPCFRILLGSVFHKMQHNFR